MEGNICDVNHLDSDVLLPPRKRLLACLKKQNGDGNKASDSPSNCISLNQLDTRISYLLKAHLSNDNPSQEEIMVASRTAADVAVKAAMAARTIAQEKAVIAAKAMAAAKKALELVANVDDDHHEISSSAEQQLEKNKLKNNVEVQMLYNNKKPRLESGKINHAIKIPKHKKLKISSISGNGKEFEDTKKSKLENGSKAKSGDDDITIFGRKRGRMKQKKLPLSICHDRDQQIPKQNHTSRSSLFVGPTASSVVERGPLWKCQAFKARVCVKQNKVVQS